MKSKITENPLFKKAMRAAYLSREKESFGDDWPFKVMKRVRGIGPIAARGFWPDFERLVWRLAPLNTVLVLALALLVLGLGSGSTSDYLGMMTAELDQPSMQELLGFGG